MELVKIYIVEAHYGYNEIVSKYYNVNHITTVYRTRYDGKVNYWLHMDDDKEIIHITEQSYNYLIDKFAIKEPKKDE